MKNYLLICEIGPIYDFVRQSRKTVDFWGASFLFSYVMSEVARDITNNGGTLFLPYLDNNPMYRRNGTIACGSVPDQIYVTFTDSRRSAIENGLKTIIEEIVKTIALKVGKLAEQKGKAGVFDHGELKDFFHFFYTIHEIKDAQPTFEEFLEAERKIRIRSALRPFRQITGNNSIAKWEKCSLCGDRKRIYSKVVDKDAGLYNEEHICSVCLLKRFLPEAVKSIFSGTRAELKKPRYQSTSDIAFSPIKACIDTADDEMKQAYKALIRECEQISEEKDSEGRFFYDPNLRKKFTAWKKSLTEKYQDKIKLPWLDRPFYSIISMDGDNMGNILKENRDKFPGYIQDVSRIISDFSNAVNATVSRNQGQLIFAGGEDINFVIHPEYLLDCIGELNNLYNGYFLKNDLTKPMAEKFTLSAGVVVCYHKYPLSQAILSACGMLRKAKKFRGKNATAISLIKGHTETFNFAFSNKLIGDLKRLKELLLSADISRTTPYRIKESEEVLKAITDARHKENYLYTIIAGTRGVDKANAEIMEIVGLLMKFEGIDAMINALLYARFLAGDK
ncbi:MAG: type III-B CRISPR-associated protein Cas10/Cmr2 [Candidatus Brocadia sp.]|uniref:CRISPR-associated protein n=1 Tax=Candidatus Brocadia fulgida TaxID=380242 RepID=A0A0M2UWI2_9BACT|nr:MAG: CRISPR-associated protein [Candidatus Brocadia fulgida]UJS21580.1 MAG: type III-B CRISPR-associated protein Cas10/Cmr2 [Candidatus Brocadia sp.]